MILKKLTATGFKSFADKTEFDFDAGITCIVGPNGCGKSNIVDAIKWVLGEQSAKSLRGKQMMDVIFNGSGTRKSSGLAQIDLAFDNTDHFLPSDQAEVVVSRRLYRSGESEYLLNKQACRLRDIRELFLDTGVSTDAYSVIEQGRVDVLLQANPADRRAIFEEAAGINKYKVRRKEAQRRLERVDQNLLRVQDVVEEIEKRLRSVKLAAGKARNYQTYTQRLRELRSRYALAEYHRLHESYRQLESEVDTLSDESTRRRTGLCENEAKTSEANVRILSLEQEMGETENRLLATQSQITAHEERIAAADHRIVDQDELLRRSQERLSGFDERTASLAQRLGEQQQAAIVVDEALATVRNELAALQDQERSGSQELVEARQRLEDEKAGIIDLLRRTSQLNNEIQGLNLQHESLTSQKSRLDRRDAEIASKLAEVLDRQKQLQDRRDEIHRLIREQEQKLEETGARAKATAEKRAGLTDQLSAAKEYRSGLQSRRQLLEEMDRKHEGLLTGAREVLERRDACATDATCATDQLPQIRGANTGGTPVPQHPFDYVLGAVGELFEADVAHAGIVEAVLGNHEKYLVAWRRDSLLADLDELSTLTGRVQAFCLDCIPPAMGGPDLSGQEGFIADLLDWVRYPESCAHLARHLLGRTYVVESLHHARELARLDPGTARFVTMDGVVLEPDGRVGLGPLGAGTGMISRRSEMRDMARELGEVDGRIEGLTEAIRQSEAEANHLEDLQQQLRSAVYDANTQRVRTETELSSVETVVQQLSQERPLIASEVSTLVAQLRETQEKERASKDSLSHLEHRSTEGERMIEEQQKTLSDLVSRQQAVAERITTARVRSGELAQRKEALTEATRELDAAQTQLRSERDKAERDVAEARRRIEQSQEQIETARRTLADLRTEHEELAEKSKTLRDERDGLRMAVEEYAAEARTLRAELEDLSARLHERQMKSQESRVRTEDLVARIAEELSVDLEAQYEGYQPDQEEDWPAVEAEIDELRRKIDRLGNVNLDAIHEQEELESRLAFLTGQLEDLRASERQLLALIEKLNTESEKRFTETFRAVQGHFAALFKKLFGGGKAELTLMDPDNVLECGIDILARPPGKELQSISLLSGGEKTLTAIALLLAVFRSKPSPFALLDEVDAALDEANNVRFNHLIQEFAQRSQFIVITHSKRTMSIADVMYGITMQEAGVSKRVSVRFEDERRHESAVA